ncbi:hypothetical protein ABBQ32_012905 [Trebouxia sp. C0010 RCD-2024]
MAHMRESATAAPQQQQPSRTTGSPETRQNGARALLLPVDDTDESERACQWAAENIYRQGDTVHLLHVVPEPSMVHVWPGMYVPPDDDAEQDEVNDAVRMIRKRFTSHLKLSKIPCQVHVAVAGTETDHLAKLINEKAEEIDAACIVMASHGKTSFQEFWAGSTSSSTSQNSSRPICIIPAATAAKA